jgi:PAS domain S-box-containing protein
MDTGRDLSLSPDLCYPRLLRGALDACETHVLITDRKGLIVFANAALAHSHGCGREELVGKPASAIMPTELNLEQIEKIREAYREEKLLRIVAQGRHANGSSVWVSMVIQPIPDAAGRANHFVSIGTDITQQIEDARIKQELQQRIWSQEREQDRMAVELRLAQKLEAVGRLAAGVAHEINTPIQFVAANVTFARSSVADVVRVMETYRRDPARGREAADALDLDFLLAELPKALDGIQEGVDRVTAIIGAMKEYSHPGSEARSSADINRALDSTLTIAQGEYKRVATIERAFGPLPLVPCNISELNQVFLNILVNAAHAIEQSGKNVVSGGRIRIATTHVGAEVVLSFEDNGCGIPARHLEKIFDPFFTTKEVGKGTGQGLAIARAIVVDRHGGAIDVDSEVGQGTCITIRLPVAGVRPVKLPELEDVL